MQIMPSTQAKPLLWDENRLADPHAQHDKAARVRAMFDAIAPTYERLNSLLSAGRDAAWRRRAVQMARVQPGDVVLDLACGTGDLARAFAEAHPARVVGCDFSLGMLNLAVARPGGVSGYCAGDALDLPFADGAFDIVSCAFGVRNFQRLADGLAGMSRVLSPRGRAVILEFSMPRTPLLGRLYQFYFHQVLPRVGALVSGDRSGAYSYLPKSVASFADADELASALRRAGFARVERASLTFGVVHVLVAWKQP